MIKVKVKDLIEGYNEDAQTGRVVAWGGKLDVRPKYQREFVYDEDKRDAVIRTIIKNFPLNIMYFVKREDDMYEVLDGQQRIISICRYATNSAISAKLEAPKGGHDAVNFNNLFDEDRDTFLDYELQVYICEGTEKEKLQWFQIINIAGEVLYDQEIRNAIFHGKWLTDAKSLFSKTNCAAHKRYSKYLKGKCIRQDYLETAIKWRADEEGIAGDDCISAFMQKHREDDNADELWHYIENVFEWVENTFGSYQDNMKGVAWGLLYNKYRHDNLDPSFVQEEIKCLMEDPDVQKKAGIYEYILSGDEKVLKIRLFDDHVKKTIYAQQEGKCKMCGKSFDYTDMAGDHIVPWSKGGKTVIENCQMLCNDCNMYKSNK